MTDIFVNEDVAGSVPPAAHVRYRHKFQELAAGIALRAEHAVSANLSSRLQAGGIYPPHGDSKLELYHNVRDPLAIPRNAEYCNLPVKNVTGEEGILSTSWVIWEGVGNMQRWKGENWTVVICKRYKTVI